MVRIICRPWLAGGSGLASEPSIIMRLGALTSYFLFAAGWALFGIASVRARVFPLAISIWSAPGLMPRPLNAQR